MKSLLLIILLLPTVLFSQYYITSIENYSKINKIEDRDVRFGVKETVEELMSNIGYNIGPDSTSFPVYVDIDVIESPQQILNIIGLKWLKKDYIVTTSIGIGESKFSSTGKRSTYLFAALLDIENNEIPLNRKAFSKSLQSSLKQTVKQLK
jgi:hypothetical protein